MKQINNVILIVLKQINKSKVLNNSSLDVYQNNKNNKNKKGIPWVKVILGITGAIASIIAAIIVIFPHYSGDIIIQFLPKGNNIYELPKYAKGIIIKVKLLNTFSYTKTIYVKTDNEDISFVLDSNDGCISINPRQNKILPIKINTPRTYENLHYDLIFMYDGKEVKKNCRRLFNSITLNHRSKM